MCRPPTGRSGTRVDNKKKEKQIKQKIKKNKKTSPREHGLLPQSVLAMVPGQQGAAPHFFYILQSHLPHRDVWHVFLPLVSPVRLRKVENSVHGWALKHAILF